MTAQTPPDADADAVPVRSVVEHLVFLVRERSLALPIDRVVEIRGHGDPTPLPHAPPHVLGVVNLRGTVLPVIDLAQRLGLGPTPASPRNVMIVVDGNRGPFGLLVDGVSEILSPEADALAEPPDGLRDGFVNAVVLRDDAIVQVLDPDAVGGRVPEDATR